MNNWEISTLMRTHPSTRSMFGGVYAKNTLPSVARDRKPVGYIVNTEEDWKMGEHWICLYFPLNGLPEYFDSFNFKPLAEFEFILGNTYRLPHSRIPSLQNYNTTVCGQYCLYYLCMRYVFNFSMDDILRELLYLKMYEEDVGVLTSGKLLTVTDLYVNKFVERYFGVEYDVFDERFLLDRLSLLL